MLPTVILVRPQYSGNLGSVARAMKNMGHSELFLVQPEALPRDSQAKTMAAHAKDLLGRAKIFSDLEKALKGFDMVVGTSRRQGKDRSNFLSPREFAEYSLSFPGKHRTALLFGPEDTGLTNQEITLCQRIISIPSHRDFPSLNLAQAVMVVCYENFLMQKKAKKGLPKESKERAVAKLENLEAMYLDLGKLLKESGFLDKNNPQHMMRMIRNLLNRARPAEKEVKIIRGICRQMRWWAGGQGKRGKKPSQS